MGEEYAEEAPFLYFTSHKDQKIIEPLQAKSQDPRSFYQSRLNWEKRYKNSHKVLLEFYHELIKIRRSDGTFVHRGEVNMDIQTQEDQGLILLHRHHQNDHALIVYNFSKEARDLRLDLFNLTWEKVIDSSEKKWLSQGPAMPQKLESPCSCAMSSLSFVFYKNIK